jgi:hypothetical protein
VEEGSEMQGNSTEGCRVKLFKKLLLMQFDLLHGASTAGFRASQTAKIGWTTAAEDTTVTKALRLDVITVRTSGELSSDGQEQRCKC